MTLIAKESKVFSKCYSKYRPSLVDPKKLIPSQQNQPFPIPLPHKVKALPNPSHTESKVKKKDYWFIKISRFKIQKFYWLKHFTMSIAIIGGYQQYHCLIQHTCLQSIYKTYIYIYIDHIHVIGHL